MIVGFITIGIGLVIDIILVTASFVSLRQSHLDLKEEVRELKRSLSTGFTCQAHMEMVQDVAKLKANLETVMQQAK